MDHPWTVEKARREVDALDGKLSCGYAAIEAARWALDQLTWRPIETAPRDGSRIVVTAVDETGYHGSDVVWSQPWMGDEFPWKSCSDDHVSYPTASWTHWMPLPPPPEQG